MATVIGRIDSTPEKGERRWLGAFGLAIRDTSQVMYEIDRLIAEAEAEIHALLAEAEAESRGEVPS